VLLFGNNPVYRGETIGTYALVFNAILNYQRLAQKPAPADQQPPVGQTVGPQGTSFGGGAIPEQQTGR
jgi:hypothetical protein